MQDGAEGLQRDKTRPSRIPALTLETVALVVARTHEALPGETTHWTASLMARDAGIRQFGSPDLAWSRSPALPRSAVQVVGLSGFLCAGGRLNITPPWP